jgi:hypothetical protein
MVEIDLLHACDYAALIAPTGTKLLLVVFNFRLNQRSVGRVWPDQQNSKQRQMQTQLRLR